MFVCFLLFLLINYKTVVVRITGYFGYDSVQLAPPSIASIGENVMDMPSIQRVERQRERDRGASVTLMGGGDKVRRQQKKFCASSFIFSLRA